MTFAASEPDHELLHESAGGVVRLTLNRPAKRHALSQSLLSQLGAALEEIAADSEARVVVLAANGPVFCSGHDLTEMTGRSEAEYRAIFERCAAVMQQIRRLPQPVIARVQGLATAAGCQLAASCDLVVAAAEAAFATPGVKIGLFCTTPMTPLVRAIPAKAAMEMLLTGQPISAARAYELGLVNRVARADELDDAVNEFVAAIIEASSLVTRLGKAAFYQQLALAESEAYPLATETMIDNAVCRDAQEGMSAFLAKRSPRWEGRKEESP
ncbi:MAG TPA: enoyl-CoA hydratase [Pirellulales bacterium]|nr:enoyl-CoA hydratase [Pirellulales bacterium]